MTESVLVSVHTYRLEKFFQSKSVKNDNAATPNVHTSLPPHTLPNQYFVRVLPFISS